MPLNSPGGSTLQWGRGEVCCASHHVLFVVLSASATASCAGLWVCVHVEEQGGKVLGLRPGDDRLLTWLPTEVLLWLQRHLGRPLSQSATISSDCSFVYTHLLRLTTPYTEMYLECLLSTFW